MEHNYRISFKMGDRGFEIESTNLQWIKNKEKEYLQKVEGKKSRATEEVEPLPESHTELRISPTITLNEFHRKYVYKIKSRPTIAVFLLYYLDKIKKKDKIKTADLANCFKEIHYPNWNHLNFTDILISAKRRALVNYVNKLWSLTTTGEDFVLNMVSGKAK